MAMAVLRRIRLKAAREALARADPPVSIREIAAQYGFTNPGRFAKRCRDTFGQSPKQMLRRTEYP
jgi:transcriptional regulator GlxA family with amidase domain